MRGEEPSEIAALYSPAAVPSLVLLAPWLFLGVVKCRAGFQVTRMAGQIQRRKRGVSKEERTIYACRRKDKVRQCVAGMDGYSHLVQE